MHEDYDRYLKDFDEYLRQVNYLLEDARVDTLQKLASSKLALARVEFKMRLLTELGGMK